MQLKFLSFLAGMAATAVANDIKHVEVVHVLKALNVRGPVAALGFTPNKHAAVLFARADDAECSKSIMSLLADTPTPTGDLKEWFLDVVPTADPCKLTIAASLSEPLESYLTKFGDYLVSKNGEAEKIAKDCDINPQEDAGLVPTCSGGGSIYFADAKTTKVASLMYQTVSATGNAAAPRATGMVGAVAAAVGAAGAVMAL